MAIRIGRRELIAALGGAAAWPLAARAQAPMMPTVAFLSVGSPEVVAGRVGAFRKGLSETGYVEGQNVAVEYHWLEGKYGGLKNVLNDLMQRRVAVIAIPGRSSSGRFFHVLLTTQDAIKFRLIQNVP